MKTNYESNGQSQAEFNSTPVTDTAENELSGWAISLEEERISVPATVLPQGAKRVYRGVLREGDYRSPLQQWFANLPIKQKLINTSVLSQILSIAGITGVGAFLLYTTGQNQIANQAESEVAVTQIGYMIKVNQMGFGFRGQSDNVAIIDAARHYAQGKPLPAPLRSQVKQILKNEVKARKMEYATLVGKDNRVIVNANADRTGQIFTPNNFIRDVINDPRQLKVTAIVPWSELQKEKPPLPPNIKPQDALIRYTFTPVRDNMAKGKPIIGVLISGDIVNSKTPIVEQAIRSFDSGYSAVYYRNSDGKFTLASSLYNTGTGNPSKGGIELTNTKILEKALASKGKPITQRMQIEGKNYTVSVKTLPNVFQERLNGPVQISASQPIAFLVRGTSEVPLNALLRDSLGLQLLVALLALGLAAILANLLGGAIAQPLERLQEITQRFAQGNRKARTVVNSTDEIGTLSYTFNLLADNIVANEEFKELEVRRKQLLADVAKVKDANQLIVPLGELLTEVRESLKADRVVIYRFLADGSGYIAGESVGVNLPSAFAANVKDDCIPESLKEEYKQGRTVAWNNVLEQGINPEHRQLLQSLDVKSLLITPIIQNNELFGLAIAHHCHSIHVWQEEEKAILGQFTSALAQSLAGLALIEQKELEAKQQQEQNQILQQELFKLLSDVEGAASGDLTVRAEISAGQIGIVADFFNAIIESLRELVTRVKDTASQVNDSVQDNEGTIRLLASDAIAQANQINDTLNSVSQMTNSIQMVAKNAQAAANISRQASESASIGGEAMDKTVDSIVQLRGTIAETAKKVKRLGESSQQISKVIALINQIALKTNLLAVNASIEAARAGEEGRGFAVVAEEVGELAAQSANATKEIEGIVEAIQRETSEVVKAMEVGTSQVVEGTRLVEQTKTSLGKIVEVSQSVDTLLQSISKATVSQTESSEKVAQLMATIAEISQKTSQTSEQVSHNLQEAVAIAQELQTSVETFKVD
jgi:twitching motility protein PilJ